MSGISPDVVLYDASGNPLAVANGAVAPTSSILVSGSDGTNLRFISTDSSGRQVVIGAGVAGTPAGGVVSIQGVSGGTVVPISITGTNTISGTVTANQGTANTAANSWPVEVTDGTNILGTSGHPIRIDPTGTTTQPVSGTVTANQGGSPWSENITQFGGVNISTGIGASGTGIPRVTVSNDSNILATQSGTWTVQPGNTANTTPWLATINQGGNSAAVKAASTAPLTTDAALVITESPNSPSLTDTTASGTLGALNANVSVSLAGQTGSGFQLAAGTLIGTIVPEVSTDGGTTWNPTYIDQDGGNKVSSVIFASSNAATTGTIAGVGGTGLARIRVSAYTSGTANITLRASDVNDPSILYGGIPGATVQPPTAAQIAGWDSATTTLRVPAVKGSSTAAVVADQALVVTISPNSAAIQTTVTGSTATTGVAFGRVLYGGSAGVLTPVRLTAYTEQTTNFTGSVKSSSVNDTSAGTGARTVTITYYDQTGAGPLTETVTLNGTTAVNLVNTKHCFIEKMVVATVGSTGSNAGTITLFTGAAGAGTAVGTIAFGNIVSTAGDNETQWAHHYVAASKTASLFTLIGGTTGNQTGLVFLKTEFPLTANATENQSSDYLVVALNVSSISRLLANPIKVAGFARVTMYVISNGTNTNFFGSFDYSEQ